MRKAFSPIGIDFQGNSAKMLQLWSDSGKAHTLAAAASVSFTDSLLKVEEEQPQRLVDEIKAAVKAHGFQGKKAVISLPPKKADVRTLTLPGAEADLDKMLKWEAESYLHFDVANACIDYVKLGEVNAGNEKRSEVLVTAARRNYITRLLDLLAKAGLTVDVIDIVPMALCRLGAFVTGTDSDSPVSLLDIGRTSTIAVISNRGDLRLTRNIPRGGEQFTARIMESLDVSLEEAELLKREYGTGVANRGLSFGADQELVTKTEVAGTIHEILRSELEDVASELHKLFRYFATQCKGASVGCGYLCGGGGRTKGLDAFLSEKTSVRIEMLPTLNTLFAGRDAPECGPEYAVAAGLALRTDD